jgi:hypothetical protein
MADLRKVMDQEQLHSEHGAVCSDDPVIELEVQAILARRKRANASGQDGADIDNIRAALSSMQPN